MSPSVGEVGSIRCVVVALAALIAVPFLMELVKLNKLAVLACAGLALPPPPPPTPAPTPHDPKKLDAFFTPPVLTVAIVDVGERLEIGEVGLTGIEFDFPARVSR